MKEEDMENKSVYDNFIAWMKRSWIGLSDSDDLLPAVKARYSEDEAVLLTGMPFSPKDVRELAAQKGMIPTELSRALDALAQKGLVFRMKKGEKLFYGLNDGFLVFLRSSFWPGGTDEESRRVAPMVNAYFHTGLFDPYEGVRTRGLRAIPIETSITSTSAKQSFLTKMWRRFWRSRPNSVSRSVHAGTERTSTRHRRTASTPRKTVCTSELWLDIW
jgi:hypothetical protein